MTRGGVKLCYPRTGKHAWVNPIRNLCDGINTSEIVSDTGLQACIEHNVFSAADVDPGLVHCLLNCHLAVSNK